MIKFKKILFPVDLSDVSPKIVPWVIAVAERLDSEIHLLFVVRKLVHLANIDVAQVSIENFQAEIVGRSEAEIERFANMYFSKHKVSKISVVLGDPAEEILNYGKSEEIDLIIIGTHGRKGLEKILFGSVAERVIKMSPTPVMSINPYRVQG